MFLACTPERLYHWHRPDLSQSLQKNRQTAGQPARPCWRAAEGIARWVRAQSRASRGWRQWRAEGLSGRMAWAAPGTAIATGWASSAAVDAQRPKREAASHSGAPKLAA